MPGEMATYTAARDTSPEYYRRTRAAALLKTTGDEILQQPYRPAAGIFPIF